MNSGAGKSALGSPPSRTGEFGDGVIVENDQLFDVAEAGFFGADAPMFAAERVADILQEGSEGNPVISSESGGTLMWYRVLWLGMPFCGVCPCSTIMPCVPAKRACARF
jgi:hypothetical protein